MFVLKVPRLNPENSAAVEEKLNETGISYSFSATDQTVSVNGCMGCVGAARKALNALGLDSEIIAES